MTLQFSKDEANGFTIFLSDSNGNPVTGQTSGDVTVYASKSGGSSLSPSYSTFNETDSSNMPGLYFVEFGPSVFDTFGEIVFHFSGSNFESYRSQGQVQVSHLDLDLGIGQILSEISNIKGSGFSTGSHSLVEIQSNIDSTDSDLKAEFDDVKGSGFSTGSHSLVSIRDRINQTRSDLLSDLDTIKGSGFQSSDDALQSIRSTLETNQSQISNDLSGIQGTNFQSNSHSLVQQSSELDSIQSKTDRIIGLSDENIQIDNYQYDQDDNLTSSTLTIYPSEQDLKNETNPIGTYEMNASYDTKGRLESYDIRRTS